ncbi:MAG TPA: hypothetical protein VGB38_04675 [bacterium]
MLKKFVPGFFISFWIAASISAQDGIEEIEIHGFLSQGYLKSSDNNYLVPSKQGSYEFNEAAVTFTSQVSAKLHVGAQLFSRDFGHEGNSAVVLDWAYGDYRWKDALGIRFGKIKTPYGFYNQGRDVDVLRTSVLLPQSVYDEDVRDFFLAFQGGSVYGDLIVPRIGSLDYELCYGTISVPDPNSGYWRWVFSDLAEFINRSMPIGTFSTIKDPSVTGRYLFGGALRWNTPLQGLRLGVSDYTGKINANTKLELVVPVNLAMINPVLQGVVLPTIMNMNIDINVDIKKYDAFSAEYSWNDLTLTGEYHSQDYDVNVSGIKVNYQGEGYYGQAVYRFAKWLELGMYYSEYYPVPGDKKGEHLERYNKADQPKYIAWQKDACFMARFDLTNHWILKLEGHRINGCSQVKPSNNPDGLKKNWGLFAVKTSYRF